ncbi:class F sortase [Actinoplanes sp. NPDC023801]|uniref:class F sortase n=1 Tax=Actinoplanes sp. NPDC023801 TaxID=3154595 RepID=UPI0033D33D66
MAAFALLLAVLGSATLAMGVRAQDGLPPPPRRTALAVEDGNDLPAPPPAPARAANGMRLSVPVALDIPAIKLRTPVTAMGLRRDGTIDVPPLLADAPAGWYRHSPSPGEVGAAVLVGHVDTAREGPAVFYRLRELGPGNTISVRRADGTLTDFVVTRVAMHPKNQFPSDDVYGPVEDPELRLITCGGVFDRSRGSYRNNVVVFARIAVPR